ncbi:hypothetical protein BO99DRAFT_437010 [Aspergillus violaceofuscus CBS 115571]|uniref:ABC transmembrane type-1 domain-containing protein n=1 Tax=Aspergillus violaceofuscus (strain CBS 115571) TaxID=1450538 RepID=A0A2V5GUF8_ASPV1|nr:hypothetical protein BO99DRAFT_437010 [Aspergillus violaceofuscus CBS 115571]
MLKLLRWLEQTSHRDINIGYGLLGAYAIVYMGQAIATGAYWRLQLRFITTLRGTLISALYRKALQLSDVEARKATVALMSTDVEMACTGLEQLHEVYFSLLQIGIATWLLERQVGAACVSPAIVAAICAIATYKLSQHVGQSQRAWLESVQQRLNATTSVLLNMKTVRLFGFAKDLSQRLSDLRNTELHSASKYRTILVVRSFGDTPVVTLTIYAAIRSNTWASSSASHIYTAISLLGLISSPLVAVFQLVPIEGFLASPTHADYRISPSTTGTHVESEKQAMESVRPSSDQKSGGGSRFALTIRNATFSYPGSSSVVLQDFTVNIPRSQLTLILGPAMARAVYARKELFVLDDCFSALDPQTEGKVAQRLLGPQGMMRENGQTVVVASNGERLLPYADLVILLGINGRIRAQGSPRELASHLTIPYKGNNMEENETYTTQQGPLSIPNASSDGTAKQTESKDNRSDHRKVSVYGSYFRSMGFWRGTGLCALLIFQTFFSKFPTVWLQWWLDKSPSSMASSYAKDIGVYSLFQVVSMIFTLLAAFQQLRIVMPRTSRYFHGRLLKAAMDTIEVDSVVNKFSQDLQLIDWNLPVTFLNASEGALATLAQVIIIASSFPYVFAAFPVLLAVVLAIQRFYLRTSKQVRAMDIEAKSPLL